MTVYFNWHGMVSRIVFFYKVSSLDLFNLIIDQQMHSHKITHKST